MIQTWLNGNWILWIMIVGCLCNVTCALLGSFLVLRRLSLVGDAISHAVLPGLAIAFLLSGTLTGWPIFVGAMVMGVLTVFLTDTVQRLTGAPEDASLGVVFTAFFALGVILITRLASQVDLDPGCILYGLIEFTPLNTISFLGLEIPRAMLTILPAMIFTILFLTFFWKELKITAFDPALATAIGFPAWMIHYLLMALVAGVTVSSFEAVGSILVIAMLIVPGATAHLLTDRLHGVLLWSVVVALTSAIGGTLWATYLNTSVAGMMAVVAGLQFALAVVFAPQHGFVSKWVRNYRMSLRIACEDVLGQLYRVEEAQLHEPSKEPQQIGSISLPTQWALLRSGMITRGDMGNFTLTDEGRATGASLVRAHRLWESYLQNELDLPLDHLHDPAEAMEHFLDLEMQAHLLMELHQPQLDPHGQPIPPLE